MIEGCKPPELIALDLEMPEAAKHIWDWFQELSETRQNGMSINRITYTEIYSWSFLTGACPLPWEVAAIKALDRVFVASILEDSK
jgi:hypothetical protein